MQKNSEDFSMQEALRLAKSPAGQQLLALLRQSDPGTLQQAVQQASNGDYTQAKASLQDILSSPEARALLRELGGSHG